MNKILIVSGALIIVILGAVVLLKGSSQKTQIQQSITTKVLEQPSTKVSTSSTEITKTTNVLTVSVTTNGFEPATVKIKTGTKVVWINKSGKTVTVNSDKHPTHLLYPPLNLGEFEDSKSVSLVFDKPGSYGYHNHLDPNQTGTVVVE